MNTSHHLFNPFRAIPVVFALILNVVMGPFGPVVQSQLLGNQTVMAYVGSTAFELDGNIDTTTAGHDWNQVHTDFLNGNTALSGADNVAFITDKVDTTADDIFTGGGSKDQQKIQTGPWLWTTSKPQPKDDITHAFAAAYTIGGHTIAYFGLDKYEVDGDNQVGFWFFKNPVAKTNTSSQGGFTFSGEHAVGDILVLSDYTNGGTVPNFTVYKWVGSGGSDGSLDEVADTGACTNASQYACGITNGQQFTSSAWPYQNRDVAANTWPAGGLFEGGLDLTHFNLDTGCFSSFLAETRSSQSVTATLSDFALGQFSFCAPPDMTTQVSQATASVGDSFTDSATLSGTKGDIGGKVDFYVCGPTQSAQDCASTANQVSSETIANPDNPVTVTSDPFTPNAAGGTASWRSTPRRLIPSTSRRSTPTTRPNASMSCRP